jgi:hypothetical protein
MDSYKNGYNGGFRRDPGLLEPTMIMAGLMADSGIFILRKKMPGEEAG